MFGLRSLCTLLRKLFGPPSAIHFLVASINQPVGTLLQHTPLENYREISRQCKKSASEVLVLDSFFLKRVAEEFGIAEKKSIRQKPAPIEEILRFARVAKRQLSVDDLFSHRYWLLPFCDRCVACFLFVEPGFLIFFFGKSE
jgi:hypothetical protein